jgi:hypothetical protein
MTKGVALATMGSKDRELPPNAPASGTRNGEADDQAESFTSVLETASPKQSDERDRDDDAKLEVRGAEHEHGRGHANGPAATSIAPADLSFAWLARSNVLPPTPSQSGTTPMSPDAENAAEPAGPTNESSIGTDPAGPNRLDEETTAAPPLEDALATDEASPTSPASGAPTELAASAESRTSAPGATSLEKSPDVHSVASARTGDPADDNGRELRRAKELTTLALDAEPAAPLETGMTDSPRASRTVESARGNDPRLYLDGPGGGTRDRVRQLPAAPPPKTPEGPTAGTGSAERGVGAAQIQPPTRAGEVAARFTSVLESTTLDQGTGGGSPGANTDLNATLTRSQRGSDGSYHVTALLNPPSLGRIEATIKVNGTTVEIAITPHTAVGHEALSTHLDELQRELAADHGDVHLTLRDGGGQPRHGSDHKQEPSPTRAQDEDVPLLVGHALSYPPTPDTSLHIVL